MLGSRANNVVAALPLSDRKIESLNGKTINSTIKSETKKKLDHNNRG